VKSQRERIPFSTIIIKSISLNQGRGGIDKRKILFGHERKKRGLALFLFWPGRKGGREGGRGRPGKGILLSRLGGEEKREGAVLLLPQKGSAKGEICSSLKQGGMG